MPVRTRPSQPRAAHLIILAESIAGLRNEIVQSRFRDRTKGLRERRAPSSTGVEKPGK
jgi:hypothetical protein